MAKPIKSRREYECEECKQTINKGDTYFKKNVRLGSSKPNSFEDGCYVMHGVTITKRFCKPCIDKDN